MNRTFDKIFHNGKIFTSDEANLYAEAFAVRDGRIAWIGTNEELEERLTADSSGTDGLDTVDLKGRRVLPGFIDSHLHPLMYADSLKQIPCLHPVVSSIEDIIESIRAVREKQGVGLWIEGWGYDEGKLFEKRMPNCYDLDKGAADVPVNLVRICAHVHCVNSKALELAGIDRNTPDPPGGKIDRDENGEPTGILRENARDLLTPVLPLITEESAVENMLNLNQLLLSQGITGISDMCYFHDLDCYPVFIKAASQGFRPRIATYYLWDTIKETDGFTLTQAQMDRAAQIRVAGIKMFSDGSVSGRNAWCDKPYLGEPDNYGFPICTPEEIADAAAFCKKHHCQMAVHAMGSRAIDRVISAVETEANWMESDQPYVRMEHVAMPTRQAVKRAAESKISFVTQPSFLCAEIETYLENIGLERTRECYPISQMLEAGVTISFSSDAPATALVNPSNPFVNIENAVTRIACDGTDCNAEHRTDVETAVILYTVNPGRILGLAETGALKAGCHADFIVLDRDLLAVPAEEIHKANVLATYMGGECVYRGRDHF